MRREVFSAWRSIGIGRTASAQGPSSPAWKVQSSDPGIATFGQRVDHSTITAQNAAELGLCRLRQSIKSLVFQGCWLQRRGNRMGADHSSVWVVIEGTREPALGAPALAGWPVGHLDEPAVLAVR
jgi:hypothetical protein